MRANQIAPTPQQPVALRLTGAMLTDIGRVRPQNEDAVAFVLPSGDADNRDSLALVADGMGGHAAGEVASALAAEVVRRVFFELDGAPSAKLAAAFEAANKAVFAYAQDHPECAGMGTTCTALAVRDDRAWLAHVGDSRAYLLRGASLTQLSEDHTLVAKLVRDGVLTAEEASTSEHSNVILQALGTSAKIKPDVWSEGLRLSPGDAIVLCSDGLHGAVPDRDIAEIAARLAPLEACRSLIERALEAGGDDNISVGVFRVLDAADSAGGSADSTTRRLRVPKHLLSDAGAAPRASARFRSS
jgi:PPM family protein phosphatase